MASTNQSPQYQKAESEFLKSQTDKDKLYWLEEMIKECPKHKSAEKMLSQLRLRLKKLKEKIETAKKKGKGGKEGIKKAEMQAVLIGFANSGKSSILSKVTNASPDISEFPHTTFKYEIGTLIYEQTQIQIIDQPSIGNENFDIGIVNTADTLLLVVDNFEDIEKIKEKLTKAKGKQIVIYNKSDLLNEKEKRKIQARLCSNKYNALLFSAKTEENIEELKEKIFETFDILRIYLKEPGKEPTNKPLIMKPGSNIKDVAEKIKKGLSSKVKETKITGPSSKFPNQRVGLTHILKDKDIVEFKTI